VDGDWDGSGDLRHTGPVRTAVSSRVTYREVLGVREFRAILLSQALSTLGDQVTRVAVALLVFQRSGSAFAASATYACSYLTWLVGGTPLSAFADRYPRRTVMVVSDVARAGLVVLLAFPGLPLVVVFALLVLTGFLAPPFDSARSALLPDLLPGDRYVVGNALMNGAFQGGQVAGFLVGGALVAAVSYRGALLVDAATFVVSAAVLLLVVPAGARTERDGRTSLLRETVEGVRAVAGNPRLRWLLAYALLSTAVAIPAEGLAVAVASSLGRGSVAVGALTATIPAGFLLGSVVVLRVEPSRRLRLLPGLALLGSAPLLLTVVLRNPFLIGAVWVLAGAGNALQLVASAEYVSSTPPELRGRAYGVAGTCLMAVQGLVLLVVGAAADELDPRTVITLTGVVGLLVLPLVMLLSPERKDPAQEQANAGRESQG